MQACAAQESAEDEADDADEDAEDIDAAEDDSNAQDKEGSDDMMMMMTAMKRSHQRVSGQAGKGRARQLQDSPSSG